MNQLKGVSRMKKLMALKKGDVIDLVAPGFACTQAELNGSIEIIRQWGFIPRLPEQIFHKDLLFSSPDEVRFEFLGDALLNLHSKAIWCLRGGYGTSRLLPYLEHLVQPHQAKIVVGLSDITALHSFLIQKWKWPVLHGPLLDRIGTGKSPAKVVNEVKRILVGEQMEVCFNKLKPMNGSASQRGVIRSSVVGGNLTVLQCSLGTPWEFNADGKILFLEDIGERGYRLDRMLNHFIQAGKLRKTAAIVFGDFTSCFEPDGKQIWQSVLREFAQTQRMPVFMGLPSGHAKIQRPLPMGTKAILKMSAQPLLQVATEIE